MSGLPPIPWETAICTAIARRVEIEYTFLGRQYDMQPYILFVEQSGNRRLRGVQFGIGWTEVPVDQIKNIAVTSRSFNLDAAFDGRDPRYHKVICSV
jgi:hypothetical protein